MMKIAICDDDYRFSEILKEKIESIFTAEDLKYDVSIYNSGADLINFVNQYDLIFLDVEMPNGNL